MRGKDRKRAHCHPLSHFPAESRSPRRCQGPPPREQSALPLRVYPSRRLDTWPPEAGITPSHPLLGRRPLDSQATFCPLNSRNLIARLCHEQEPGVQECTWLCPPLVTPSEGGIPGKELRTAAFLLKGLGRFPSLYAITSHTHHHQPHRHSQGELGRLVIACPDLGQEHPEGCLGSG